MTKTLATILLSLIATSASAWSNYHYDPLRVKNYKAFCKKILAQPVPPPFVCDRKMSLDGGRTTVDCYVQEGESDELYHHNCEREFPQFKN
ncbi:MAG: hypothetical protein IPL32_17875 [Chloracidobacterium sp.]|nr:hypothetical protein [Chloracidobacterium sp.]